jgi:hypothetical protein
LPDWLTPALVAANSKAVTRSLILMEGLTGIFYLHLVRQNGKNNL